MAQLVDHFLTGLTLGEGEHCPMRRKQEHRLTQLLAELLDTERKYVDDLETVRVIKMFVGSHSLYQSTAISPPSLGFNTQWSEINLAGSQGGN